MKRVPLPALAPLLLAAAAAAPARASEPQLFGFGFRSAAMAGTGVAAADDWEATYENPAGLSAVDKRRLVLGYVHATYSLRLDGQSTHVDDTDGVYLGAQLPIPLGGALAGRLTLGLGFYLPAGVINRAQSPYPDVPYFDLLAGRTQTVSVTVGGAARLGWGFSVGGGVIALAALKGSIDLDADVAGRFSTRSEEQLVASYAPIVGVRWERGRVRLGAVYRGESQSGYDIIVRNRLSGLLPFDLPTLRFYGINQYDPHTVAVEGAVAVGGGITLVGNAGWEHWSAFPPPQLPATGWADGMAPSVPPPGLHDTFVPRVAIEWSRAEGATRSTLRAGYFFAPSPATVATDSTLIDADRHALSLGFEVAWHNRHAPLRFTGMLQMQELAPSARAAGTIVVGGLGLGADL